MLPGRPSSQPQLRASARGILSLPGAGGQCRRPRGEARAVSARGALLRETQPGLSAVRECVYGPLGTLTWHSVHKDCPRQGERGLTPGDNLYDVVRKGLSEETVEARDVCETRARAQGCGGRTAQTRATSRGGGCRVACGLRRGGGRVAWRSRLCGWWRPRKRGRLSSECGWSL